VNFNVNFNISLSKYIVRPLVKIKKTLIISRRTVKLRKKSTKARSYFPFITHRASRIKEKISICLQPSRSNTKAVLQGYYIVRHTTKHICVAPYDVIINYKAINTELIDSVFSCLYYLSCK
jgi:hypothetical protein